MNANDKAIFGKSIATKKWFALVDQYPQVIDIIGQFRIDSEPLEDEDEAKVERYYASVKKKSISGISVKKAIGNGNKSTIDQIEKIVNSKKGKYLTIGQYEKIKSIMLSNKYDPFNNEEDYKELPSDIRELIEDSEMYYGFTENEIKRFLKKVNSLGYTFNYVDVATQNNEGFSHSFKPYALRKLVK
jgi:hypothetical protein